MNSHLITAFTAIVLILGLTACGSQNSNPDVMVSFYNSDLQKIDQLAPLDTLSVAVSGLGNSTYYSVAVEDPEGNEISKIEVQSDLYGSIDMTPLWYESGLKKPDLSNLSSYIDTSSVLSLISFTIRIKNLDTNENIFHQALSFLPADFTTASRPKPIVMACYKDGENYSLENAFEESGSLTTTGEVSPRTKVYVNAERIPWLANGEETTTIDIYIIPFDGNIIDDNEVLSTVSTMNKTGIAVVSGNGVTKKLAAPELIWDLNNPETQLINPSEENCAYRVIIDVDQNGRFDYGTDLDSDGKTDLYLDGIDGNNEPGFIILNTPANEVFASIKNKNTPDGGQVNSLYESSVDLDEELFLFMDNIPTQTETVDIYVIESGSAPSDGNTLTDVRAGSFSTAEVTFPGENDLKIMPFIEGAQLLNTTLGDDYSYAGNIGTDTQFNIVVDINSDGIFDASGDIFLSEANDPPACINVLAESAGIDTYTTETGSTASWTFDETGTSSGNTQVWIEVSGTSSDDLTLILFKNQTWTEGDSLLEPLLKTAYTDGDDRYSFWDLNGAVQVKNPDEETEQYNIIVDYDNDDVYDSGDLVVTVTILDTPANDLPRVQYTNIASNGEFTSGNYGYRDTFLSDCTDTYSSSYVSAGIKGIWNPYIRQYNTAEDDTTRTLYQGNYVDIYIVSTSQVNLKDWESIILSDAIDVTGRHKTLPIQYSCGNGAGMQNIWTPMLIAGSYYVIIDVNQNGVIDEGIDIIDAMNQAEETIEDDSSIVGFEVIE